MPRPRWEKQAAELAAATGETVLVGVRAHNGSWFGHCGGEEWDAANPEQAVRSLQRAWKDRLEKEAWQARAAATSVEQRLAAMIALWEGKLDDANSETRRVP